MIQVSAFRLCDNDNGVKNVLILECAEYRRAAVFMVIIESVAAAAMKSDFK